jgi:hypothetical protein
MIGQLLRARWRAAQALVKAAEIVVRDVQADSSSMVVEFLRERIGEAREKRRQAN